MTTNIIINVSLSFSIPSLYFTTNQQSSQVTGTYITIYSPPSQTSTPVWKQTTWWTGSWSMTTYFQIPLANIPIFPTLLKELPQSLTSSLHVIPSDWTIKPEFAFDSNHLAIQWTLFNNVTPISNCCRNRYNMKDTNKNAWSTVFVEILEHFWGPLNVLMDTNNPISITNLENAVSALSTAIICTNE